MQISGRSTATSAGLAAIALWSTMVGLIRVVTEDLGVAAGAALVYSTCAVALLLITGPPRLKGISRIYLWGGSLLFAIFELCFTASIGLARDGHQAIEVSIVLYLWPCLTVLFAVLFAGQRAGWLILPGLSLSVVGVALVLGGEAGFDGRALADNVTSNPTSYLLALLGAVLWAAYSTLTKLYSGGFNAVGVFFAGAACSFWTLYAVDGAPPMRFGVGTALAVALAAVATGAGYYLWNVAISRGNMTFIAAMSYFTPVVSAGFSALLLGAALSRSFWLGTAVVCVGALLCWLATRPPDAEHRGAADDADAAQSRA